MSAEATVKESLETLQEAPAMIADGMAQMGVDLWNFQIVTIDKSTITIGTMVIGVGFLIFGILMSKFFSRKLTQRVLGRLHLDLSVQHTVETLVFYISVIIFTLFAMRMANLPITIFTVVGGALAIGVGFGSQNIVNNFISGIILMIERPVKVGDMIEVEGLFGYVIHIGMRSTHISSYGNKTFIVPNSLFLERKVVNWTHLSDKNVRLNVKVGVAYGSEMSKVQELLLQAAREHPRCSKKAEHKPEVFFLDFGDNALGMELNMWLVLEKLADFKAIPSQLRFKIDELFRAHDVVVAFPQRDLHLHAAHPIKVEMETQTPTGVKSLS